MDGLDESMSEGVVVSDIQLVKGATFDTAKRYFPAMVGDERWASVLAALPNETAALIDEADINEWYPESELRRLIYEIHGQLAAGDDEQFLAIARGLMLAGVSRFFRVLINFASAQFVLRKVPVVWARIRRGPAILTSEVEADGRVLIHYDDYIYSDDAVYRLLSIANCQALVVAATKQVPRAEVRCFDARSMTLEFWPVA
jgi:hypothetical protein